MYPKEHLVCSLEQKTKNKKTYITTKNCLRPKTWYFQITSFSCFLLFSLIFLGLF